MTDDQLHADEIKQSINDPDIIEEILILIGNTFIIIIITITLL
jgi:hypothetical protein